MGFEINTSESINFKDGVQCAFTNGAIAPFLLFCKKKNKSDLILLQIIKYSDNHKPIGQLIIYKTQPDAKYEMHVFVKNYVRRKGIGRELIEICSMLLPQQDLIVFARDKKARKFYESQKKFLNLTIL